MPDIAELGLGVDSAPVTRATGELREFAAAAKTAEQSARGMGAGADKASASSTMLATSINRAVVSAAAINSSLNVRDSFGSAERTQDIAAYGRALDDVRAKYVPLFAAQRTYQQSTADINQAARTGAISEAERAAALRQSEIAFRMQEAAIRRNEQAVGAAGKGAALTSFQMSNLAFQLNDVATQAALGIGPLQILAAQGGQFYQILAQGEGGVTGSLKYIGESAMALLTPFRLAALGAAGVGVAAVAAASSWRTAQIEIQMALTGIGAASGVTAGQLNAIAAAATTTGGLTVGEAREMASALVATGRISAEVAEMALRAGKNVSKVFGEDVADAAARLARALADPAKGIDDLDKRLAAFDDRTARHIKNLAEQGRFYEAQKHLLAGVVSATDVATTSMDGWALLWQEARQVSSEFWTEFGRRVANAAGLGTVEDRINSLRASIEAANAHPLRFFFAQQITDDTAELGRLEEQLKRINEWSRETAWKRDSRALGSLVQQYAGEDGVRQKALADLERMRMLAADPEVVGRLDDVNRRQLELSIKAAEARVYGFRTSLDLAIEQNRIDIDSLAARTGAQKADIAYRQSLLRLGQPMAGDAVDARARIEAELAAGRALAEHNRQIADSQRQQLFSSRQRVQFAQLELSLVGQSAGVQEQAKSALQVRQQVEAEALRLYGDRNAYDQQHYLALLAEADQQAVINGLIRERNLMDDLRFERAQMGRSAMEADVYAKLRQAGLLTNGEIETSAAHAAAQQIRLNGILRQSADAGRDFTQGFTRDMLAGASATEALANGLNRLAQKLADLASDWAFQSLFGGKGGMRSGIAGMLGGGGGITTGGWDTIVVPSFHRGGLVGAGMPEARSVPASVFAGARRYHSGGLAGDEVPAILQKGERVLPRGASDAGGGITINMPFNVNASGTYPESVAEMKASLQEIVSGLPGRVLAVVREARDRRLA